MAKALDPAIAKIFKDMDMDPTDAVWNCHGTWVAYHRALEKVAAIKGIIFDRPAIVEADGKAGVAAVCVFGKMGDKTEWSIGEAAPGNNKNSYPWAMAEKRAKDRVVLKLLGLHGEVYSEEEADDFKGTSPKGSDAPIKTTSKDWNGPLGKTALFKSLKNLDTALTKKFNEGDIDGFLEIYTSEDAKKVMDQAAKDMPNEWAGENLDGGENYRDAFERMRCALQEANGVDNPVMAG